MRLTRREFGTLGVSLMGSGFLSPVAAAPTGTLRLSGQVVDKTNKPIRDALVSAYRGGQKLGQTTTDANGNYALTVARGATISTVQYQLSGYIDGVVNDLCGECDHSISKTLYLVGSNLGVFEAQESLSALERVYYIADDTRSLPAVQGRYVEMLKSFEVPNRLSERLNYVRNLYLTAKA
jgi:hypothetical protein